MDEVASGGATITNEISFTPRTLGYYYLSLDTAQDLVGGSGGPIVATVAVYASDSTTEIAKLRIQKGKLSVDPNLLVSQTVSNLSWCNVRIGFDISTRKFDVWFDGTQKITSYAWKSGSGTDIARIVISSARYHSLYHPESVHRQPHYWRRPPPRFRRSEMMGPTRPLSGKLHFSFDPAACSGEYQILHRNNIRRVRHKRMDKLRLVYRHDSGGSVVGGRTAVFRQRPVRQRQWHLGAEHDQRRHNRRRGDNDTRSQGTCRRPGKGVKRKDGLRGLPRLFLRSGAEQAIWDQDSLFRKCLSRRLRGCGRGYDWSRRRESIDATGNVISVTSPGPGVPGAIAMSNKVLGGGDLNPLWSLALWTRKAPTTLACL